MGAPRGLRRGGTECVRGGGGDAEGTFAASKEELEKLLSLAKIKAGPHLFLQRPTGVELVPIGFTDLLIGNSQECQVRLDGGRVLGKVAAAVSRQRSDRGVLWSIRRWSAFSDPVQLNGETLGHEQQLEDGDSIDVAGLRMRFSLGEEA